jgi:hypothetical protein
MPGTKEGNKKTAKTLKKKYGQDYFRNLGRKGAISALSQYPNRLSEMGKRGGASSAKRDLLRRNAKNGLVHQWKVIKRIRGEYYEFFNGTICNCIAVKDGKLIFIEIKSPSDLRLRKKQKHFKEVVEKLGFKYSLEC